MNREEFKTLFKTSKLVVLPVIHVLDTEQAIRNVAVARDAGCPGVFLINHDFSYDQFLPIIRQVRQHYPDYWIGVNFLAVTGQVAFPVLAELDRSGTRVDAYWADDARIDESRHLQDQPEASGIQETRKSSGWNGMYFGGTAFKKQREVHTNAYDKTASIARQYMDVVTTSGVATGHAADHEKMNTFRLACADHPLALASGITPDNVSTYMPWVDAVLVATGINIKDDFYNIDPKELSRLLEISRRQEP